MLDDEPSKKKPTLHKRVLNADLGYNAADIREYQRMLMRGPG